MGRRTLRKINPNLDYEPYLDSVENQLDINWDPDRFFANPAPLEIEVGSGKGLFIANAAQQFPDRNFLGIEIAQRYARSCAARLARAAVTNAMMFSGDAQPLFRQKIPDHSVHGVHVYFPDPWWKKRHHKRRIMNESFLTDVVRVLVPDGRLHFWTDVKEYFDLSVELIHQSFPQLQGPLSVAEKPAEHEMDFRTHFERRTRLHNEAVYRSEFVRS